MTSRIMVVEDDELQQLVVKGALEAQGYQVDVCQDGIAAIEAVSAGHYDLVVLDYGLPEVDGLAAARLIDDLMGQAGRPLLIALTADPNGLHERENATTFAFDVVIPKADGLPALLDAIAKALRSGPDETARERANDALIVHMWDDYDADPWWECQPSEDLPEQARILVVEDDDLQCMVLKAKLEAQGYDVEVAMDGMDAFRKIRSRGYDLAIIDYQLPEIDGLAIGRMVRNVMSEAVRPRLIAFTSTTNVIAEREAPTPENGGTSVYDMILSKGIELPVLLSSVNRCLRSAANRNARLAAEAHSF